MTTGNDGGYASLAWIRDKDGKEYACPIEALKGNIKDKDSLTDEERRQCIDVSTIIGNEPY